MRQLKETFASEVGASSWEESASKYPRFATEEYLERYLSTTKISGPVLAAFQQFCRRASVSVTRKQLPVCAQVLTQTIEGKEYNNIHLKLLPEDLTYSHIAETLP